MNIEQLLAVSLTKSELVVFLDRDGTMVPLSEDPQKSLMPNDMHDTIEKLNSMPGVTVAIVSARSLKYLRLDFPSGNIILAGNFGMEIYVPGHDLFIEPRAQNAVVNLTKLKEQLQTLLVPTPNWILEDHDLTLCLHWHKVAKEKIDDIHVIINGLIPLDPKLKFRKLGTSWEILPNFEWGKADGLDKLNILFESIDKAHIKDRVYLYCGDAESDEVAFSWVNMRAGVSIRVGANSKETLAQNQVATPEALHTLLKTLLANLTAQQ